MKHRDPAHANNPESILIGMTEEDMYIRGKAWRFAFSYREEGRFAVVSSARMSLPSTSELQAATPLGDPRTYKSPQFHSRLRKMLSKNIGIMPYQLSMNDDPQSVLYRSIMGIDELDTVGEDF